ncbi:hypothetical protein [Deinococcus arenicola]|uniref:Uncharacterized protein n=1 Tax=Deinococcus arenicola TaxID=2994950 RepID=A0ABU4DUL9_9DEIO|nr:hypothetical protein [Deinococcus sp. ZS9-10]MDV6376106.1 hypothetical protein [Deinococcus sp. ZS9-10]
MNTNTPRALSRTWAAHVIYRECSVITGTADYTVTMTRTADGFAATVNGQPVGVLDAARILGSAERLTVTAETLDTPPTIGNAGGCELHKVLGRLGFRDHYLTAGEALGRAVPSLAALTAQDAYTVRDYARGQWGMTA